jgi:hypothetical protein
VVFGGVAIGGGNSRDDMDVLVECLVEKVFIEMSSAVLMPSSSVSVSSGRSGRPRRQRSRLVREPFPVGDETYVGLNGCCCTEFCCIASAGGEYLEALR